MTTTQILKVHVTPSEAEPRWGSLGSGVRSLIVVRYPRRKDVDLIDPFTGDRATRVPEDYLRGAAENGLSSGGAAIALLKTYLNLLRFEKRNVPNALAIVASLTEGDDTMTTYTEDQLKGMTSAQLVELYNQHAGPDHQVKKFENKTVAVRRTLEMVAADTAGDNVDIPAAEGSCETRESELTRRRTRRPKVDTTSQLLWRVNANPKKPGASSHARFESYFGAKTVEEFLTCGGTPADLSWDRGKGYVEVV